MKKLKLLPSILMLVLCVGVLAVGVFAINPTQNSVTGTIVVDAVNADVTMTAYKDNTSGTNLGSIVTRAGDNLNIGTLKFSMNGVVEVGDVAPIVIVLDFTTSSTENLVIETKDTESFDGLTTDGANTVVNNVVSATKTHIVGLTDTETNLPAFNKNNSYQITCTLTLNELATQELAVALKLKFNIYKASEYKAYTTEVVDGKTYYTFGSFPQSQADTTGLTLTDTYTNYMAYDDATGGVAYNDIYQDQNGNEYVKLSGRYYKVEPLKWRQLTTSGGTALLTCDVIIEQVAFQNEYYYDSKKEYHTESRHYVKNEEGNPLKVNDDYIYANNYEYSDLRYYLNNTFYNNAFNSLQQQLIKIMDVKNDISTIGTTLTECDNVCNDIPAENGDPVFALSFADLVSPEYKFENNVSGTTDQTADCSTTRMVKASGYAQATGAIAYSLADVLREAEDYGFDSLLEYLVDDNVGNGWTEEFANAYIEFLEQNDNSGFWWSRSPNPADSWDARRVYDGGYLNDNSVSSGGTGALPALRLILAG